MARQNRVLLGLFLLVACTHHGHIASGMPLQPEAVSELRDAGRLDEMIQREADARSRGMNQPIARIRLQRTESGILPATYRALVILVDFTDNPCDQGLYPPNHYSSLLFTRNQYPTGSVRDYYNENSYGSFDLVGDVTRWFRMPRPYSYYVGHDQGLGAYPQNAQKLAEDAVYAANGEVDFSRYDNDDDGYVDALFIVHAGPGADETLDVDDIWSHMWVTHAPVSVDGVSVYLYSMEPENGRCGVFAHEFGHLLGLPDLYDTDYSSAGVGAWCLMASGSWGGGGNRPTHLSAWCKSQLNFAEPIVVSTNQDNAAIPAAESSPTSFRLWTYGGMGAEYFLVENRQRSGFDGSLPGAGLLIYHIDETRQNNDNENRYLVAVEQADGDYDLEYDRTADSGDPFPGSTSNQRFDDSSTPPARSYSGQSTRVSVHLRSGSQQTMRADLSVGRVADTQGPSITGTTRYTEVGDQVLSYQIETTVADASGISTVELFYRAVPEGFSSVAMDLVSGTRYRASVPRQAIGVTVEYYIQARDLVGNQSTDPAGAPQGAYSFVITDTSPPVFSYTEGPEVAYDPNGPYRVESFVYDYSGLSSVLLYYRNGASGGFSQTVMSGCGDHRYEGFIPGQPYGATVQYYVRAMDAGYRQSFDPANAPNSTFAFSVTLPPAPDSLLVGRVSVKGDVIEVIDLDHYVVRGNSLIGGFLRCDSPISVDTETDRITGQGELYWDRIPESFPVVGGRRTLLTGAFDLAGSGTGLAGFEGAEAGFAFGGSALHIDEIRFPDRGDDWWGMELTGSIQLPSPFGAIQIERMKICVEDGLVWKEVDAASCMLPCGFWLARCSLGFDAESGAFVGDGAIRTGDAEIAASLRIASGELEFVTIRPDVVSPLCFGQSEALQISAAELTASSESGWAYRGSGTLLAAPATALASMLSTRSVQMEVTPPCFLRATGDMQVFGRDMLDAVIWSDETGAYVEGSLGFESASGGELYARLLPSGMYGTWTTSCEIHPSDFPPEYSWIANILWPGAGEERLVSGPLMIGGTMLHGRVPLPERCGLGFLPIRVDALRGLALMLGSEFEAAEPSIWFSRTAPKDAEALSTGQFLLYRTSLESSPAALVLELEGSERATSPHLVTPTGKIVDPADTVACDLACARFVKIDSKRLSYWIIHQPDPGTWEIKIPDPGDQSYLLKRYIRSSPASLLMFNPAVSPGSQGIPQRVRVAWDLHDRDGQAPLCIYLGTNDNNWSGTPIADLSDAEAEAGLWEWEVPEHTPNARYLLYGISDDGASYPATSYASLALELAGSSTPPVPEGVRVTYDDSGATLCWEAIAGGSIRGYVTHYMPLDRRVPPHHRWVGAGTSCSLSDAASDIRYVCWVSAVDSSGSVSGQSPKVVLDRSDYKNHCPEFLTAGPLLAQVGMAVQWTIEASDPNPGDALSYSLVDSLNPSGVEIGPHTGELRWVPTADAIGSQSLGVEVADSRGGSSRRVFPLMVLGRTVATQQLSLSCRQTGGENTFVIASLVDALSWGWTSQRQVRRATARSSMDAAGINVDLLQVSARSESYCGAFRIATSGGDPEVTLHAAEIDTITVAIGTDDGPFLTRANMQWWATGAPPDAVPPSFTVSLVPEAVVPGLLRLYVLPSEATQHAPLVTACDHALALQVVTTSAPPIYAGDITLEGAGTCRIEVKGVDLQGNSGESSRTFSYGLLGQRGGEVSSPSGKCAVLVPQCSDGMRATVIVQGAGRPADVPIEEGAVESEALEVLTTACGLPAGSTIVIRLPVDEGPASPVWEPIVVLCRGGSSLEIPCTLDLRAGVINVPFAGDGVYHGRLRPAPAESWTPHLSEDLTISPNPSTGRVSVRFVGCGDPGAAQLSIIDAAGRIVWQGEAPSSSQVQEVVWPATLPGGRPAPPGTYWARIRDGRSCRARSFVLVR